MLFYEKVKRTELPQEEADQDEQKEKENTEVSTTDGFDVCKPDVQRTNDTNKLQSFLFDSECQSFLKSLLVICRPTASKDSSMLINKC